MAAAGWTPTVDNYLGRVTKARILQAVREAKGEPAAQALAPLKKGEMAERAAELLAGTGWLPEPLRTPGQGFPASPAAPHAEIEQVTAQEAPLRGRTRAGATQRPKKRGSPPNSFLPFAQPKGPPARTTPRSRLRGDPGGGPFPVRRSAHAGHPVRPGAPPRRAGRGGLPPLPLQRPPRTAATGWSATSTTRRAAASTSVSRAPARARARPADGPTPPPASTATCST